MNKMYRGKNPESKKESGSGHPLYNEQALDEHGSMIQANSYSKYRNNSDSLALIKELGGRVSSKKTISSAGLDNETDLNETLKVQEDSFDFEETLDYNELEERGYAQASRHRQKESGRQTDEVGEIWKQALDLADKRNFEEAYKAIIESGEMNKRAVVYKGHYCGKKKLTKHKN